MTPELGAAWSLRKCPRAVESYKEVGRSAKTVNLAVGQVATAPEEIQIP
jgi:hypothetical protein